MSQTVNDLFKNAGQDGLLSPQSVHALTNDPDMGNRVQQAFGGPIQASGSDEVILVSIMPDDSGSISAAGNTQSIIDGYNIVLDAFTSSKQRDNIFVLGKLLNGTMINPVTPLEQAARLDNNNYNERNFRGTPLYDSAWELITASVAWAETYRQQYNIMARTISLIISDGRDEHSRKHRNPKDLKQLITDLNISEDHIVAGMGVTTAGINFHDIFGDQMGIDDKWILTPQSDPSDIRKAFQMFSLTAVRLSQSAAFFSQGKAGGFGSQAAFGGFGASV